MSGVKRIITGADVPVNLNALLSLLDFGLDDEPVLHTDLCGYRGAPVVAIVAETERIAPTIIDDPAFRAELAAVVAQVHDRALVARTGEPIDLDTITDVTNDVIAAESPTLFMLIESTATTTELELDGIPDLTDETTALAGGVWIAGALALISWPLAWFLHPHRDRIAAWLGRWLLGGALLVAVAAVAIPPLAHSVSGWGAAEIALRGPSMRLVTPAGVAAFIGLLLVSAAALEDTRRSRRGSDEGADAALGVFEPPLAATGAAPSLDLARRGLVDAGDRLTNI